MPLAKNLVINRVKLTLNVITALNFDFWKQFYNFFRNYTNISPGILVYDPNAYEKPPWSQGIKLTEAQ